MKTAYQQLKQALTQYETVGSALIYEGTEQGTQFLFTKQKILWASNTEIANTLYPFVCEQKNGTALTIEQQSIFVEWFSGELRLVIFGGGHISKSLIQIGKLLGFTVIVVDDRPEFANKTRFPQADEVLCMDFAQAFSQIPDQPNNYYVVVTRGHKADELCVREILQRNYAYLGMIGSKTKVAQTKQNLETYGFSKQKIETMFAPIGLSIGAITPEEISVCIMAQIIEQKNKHFAQPISQQQLELLCQYGVTMALIVEKSGSAPRGAGARMIIAEGKLQNGSIGGGAIEHQAIQHAIHMQQQNQCYDVKRFVLQKEEGENLGMICGGSATVYFETHNHS